jgi:predicted thioesterase
VGVHVDVRHLAATPPGQRVVCTARVIHVEGAVVSFQIEARDQQELIARGLHKRRVIQAERFAARVRRKQGG